jgi:hypothetical protein
MKSLFQTAFFMLALSACDGRNEDRENERAQDAARNAWCEERGLQIDYARSLGRVCYDKQTGAIYKPVPSEDEIRKLRKLP